MRLPGESNVRYNLQGTTVGKSNKSSPLGIILLRGISYFAGTGEWNLYLVVPARGKLEYYLSNIYLANRIKTT